MLIQNLVDATGEYESPHILKKAAKASSLESDAKMEERLGRIERMLTNVVEKVDSVGPPEKPCGNCGNFGHATLQCNLNEDAQVNAIISWNNQQQQKRDPYSQSYNPGWKDHSYFKWSQTRDHPQQNPQPSKQQFQQPQQNLSRKSYNNKPLDNNRATVPRIRGYSSRMHFHLLQPNHRNLLKK